MGEVRNDLETMKQIGNHDPFNMKKCREVNEQRAAIRMPFFNSAMLQSTKYYHEAVKDFTALAKVLFEI